MSRTTPASLIPIFYKSIQDHDPVVKKIVKNKTMLTKIKIVKALFL